MGAPDPVAGLRAGSFGLWRRRVLIGAFAVLAGGCGLLPTPAQDQMALKGAAARTAWEPVLPGLLPGNDATVPRDDPEKLMAAVVAAFRAQGEVFARTEGGVVGTPAEGSAVGSVVISLADDALVGDEWRVHLLKRDGAWHVAAVERRSYCRRAISGDRCV